MIFHFFLINFTICNFTENESRNNNIQYCTVYTNIIEKQKIENKINENLYLNKYSSK